MNKIFKYQLKRLLKSKLFWGIFLFLTFFAWEVLANEIVLGIRNTAPFSFESTRYYLFKMQWVLILGVISMIWTFLNKKGKKLYRLIKATPMEIFKYMISCGSAILTVYTILLGWSVVVGIAFNIYCFKCTGALPLLLNGALLIGIMAILLLITGMGLKVKILK